MESLIPSVLSKVAWIAARPKHWADLPTLAGRRLWPDRRDIDVEHARAECERRAIPAHRLAEIWPKFSLIRFSERFPAEYQAALERCDAGPAPRHAGHVDLIYSVAETLHARRCLETGVGDGWSTFALLMSIRERPDALLVSVDRPYPGSRADRVGRAIPAEARACWRLIAQSDRRGIDEAIEAIGRADLCHYDSDKTYKGRTRSLPKLWAALRPGGVLLCDDASDNAGFLDFAADVAATPILIKHVSKHVGLLLKPIPETHPGAR